MADAHNLSRRTLIAGTVGTLGSSSLLAACTGTGPGSLGQPQGDVPPAFGKRARTVFMAAFPAQLGTPLKRIVDGFNQSQSDIYVDLQYQPDYESIAQQLIRGLAARQVPDVVLFGVHLWQRFMRRQHLEPLDDHLKSAGLSRTHFVDSLLADGIHDDRLYWIPFNRSTPLLYFNRDLFAAAGVGASGPTSWTELREMAPALGKLTAKGRHPKAYATDLSSNHWNFSGMAHAWNGSISEGLDVKIDVGGAVEAAEWLRRFIFDDGLAYQTKSITVDFQNSVTATMLQTTGQLTKIAKESPFDVGVAFCPRHHSPGTPTGGGGLSILSGIPDERKKAALQFLAYASQPEVAATWSADTGYLPVVKGSAETTTLKNYVAKNPNFKVAMDQLAVARPMDDILTRVAGTQSVVASGLERIWGQQAASQPTLTATAQELNKLAQPVRDGTE